jgi:hypothetical protein
VARIQRIGVSAFGVSQCKELATVEIAIPRSLIARAKEVAWHVGPRFLVEYRWKHIGISEFGVRGFIV